MRPKQLLPLAGSEEPLLAATVRRILPMVPAERIFVVTAERLLESTRAALAATPQVRVLAEPAARNTAPCVGWATQVIAAEAKDAEIMVLPSDHAILDEPAFLSTLEAALGSARSGALTTIGIVPTRPETGYGYIELEEPAADTGRAYAVRRFVEKPDLERAREFVASGQYLWNAGMFFFRAADMLAAIEQHLPELDAGLRRLKDAHGRADEQAVLGEVFPTLPSISIDHGVMEKQERLAVVPGSFGWNDIGSWQSAWELAQRDQHGNASEGALVAIDAHDNLVARTAAGKSKLVALVGVSGLCVIETDDAILVIPKERSQDVRQVIASLEQTGKREWL